MPASTTPWPPAVRRPPTGSSRRRAVRRRRAVLVMVIAVIVVAVALALSGSGAASRSGSSGKTRSTVTKPASSHGGGGAATSTTVPNLPRPPYPVGFTSLTVDNAGRLLPTVVRYPATAAGQGTAPLLAAGPYPLIVFSQGFDISPEAYAALLDSWAADGFVVADPSYPFTSPGYPGGVNRADLVNHPLDLRAAITTLLADGHDPSSLLYRAIDTSKVGVAGHSDGGDVSDALVQGSCCRDSRVTAAVILSGAEYAPFGGTFGGSPGVPMLVTQGTADDINPPACSEQIYDNAPMPRYYLDLVGAGHHVPYIPDWTDGFSAAQAAVFRGAVTEVSSLFWRAYLDGDHAALAQLQAISQLPGVGSLTAGAAVPLAGYCPGAPGA